MLRSGALQGGAWGVGVGPTGGVWRCSFGARPRGGAPAMASGGVAWWRSLGMKSSAVVPGDVAWGCSSGARPCGGPPPEGVARVIALQCGSGMGRAGGARW